MIPILRRLNDPFYRVMVHYNTFPDFLTQYVLHCPVGTRIELQGCNWNDGIVEIEFTRTQSGFLYNMEQAYNDSGRAFMSHYVSEENGWTLTPDAWFDMVIHPFIRNFPMLKVHTPHTSVHIGTTRADDERVWCPERFSTVAYLEMKRVRHPRTEGRRIFRNLMDLPPLEKREEASHSTLGNPMERVEDSFETSEKRSCGALDNTTSEEDASNHAEKEDGMSPNHAEKEDGMSSNHAETSNNIEVDTLHASDGMECFSSDGVLETSTNIQASLDGLPGTSDDMQSFSDDMASDGLPGTSDDMQKSSDDMASDSLPGTSDDMGQMKDETNLHKGKLIWVGRNMQTPSRIRLVPPVRIDMAKKKLIWVKRKLQMINKN
ncbi:uncharacterized protein TNCV_1623491 [Trichonephila clavipes]|nr:uncharacterized protein TNCV_1623491 [Trichonephila clavipes]